MRIACLQFAPELGAVRGNMARADAVLAAADDLLRLDLLTLPELAFTGYNHPSLDAIRPFLEPTAAGPSTAWAVATARRLRCHVSVGYPEIAAAAESAKAGEAARYNSAVLVSPDGAVLANYRKRFLYYTDETWAHEGDAPFSARRVDSLDHDVLMGICMDLNPYRFEAPWEAYELSGAAAGARASLVLLTMAWLRADGCAPTAPADAALPDLDTLRYWLARLQPLLDVRGAAEALLVLSNRSGSEGAATYAGTSTVLGIRDGELTLYGMLGRGTEEVLVADTSPDAAAAPI